MEKITLSPKAEAEIVSAARLSALANLTEKSENLITIKDIAIFISRNYNNVANTIVKLPTFPKPVSFDNNEKSRPRYIAGEVVRWLRANRKRLN